MHYRGLLSLLFCMISTNAMVKSSSSIQSQQQIAEPLVVYYEVFGKLKQEVEQRAYDSQKTIELFQNLPPEFFNIHSNKVSPFAHLLATFLFKNKNLFLSEKEELLSTLLKTTTLPTHEHAAFGFIKATYFHDYSPLAKKCDIDRDIAVNGYGIKDTLLNKAVQKNEEYVSMIALDQGANPNERVNDPILITAIRNQNRRLVKMLLNAGADINIQIPFTPLHAAATEGNMEIFDMLIAHGANCNEKATGYHMRPMDIAVKYGHVNLVKKLQSRGIKIHESASNIFEESLARGHYEIADLIEKEGTCHPDYYKLARQKFVKSKL